MALRLNPNDADIMAELSDALTYYGEMDESVSLLNTAMRLNPYYPDCYLWYLADAYFSLEQYEDTIAVLERMGNPMIASRLLAAREAEYRRVALGLRPEEVAQAQARRDQLQAQFDLA